MKATVRIPFEVEVSTDSYTASSYVKDPRIGGVFYGSPAKVKKAMAAAITKQVNKALSLQARVDTLTVIVCKDGTVLVVRYSDGGWGYEIRPRDRRGSSCLSADDYGSTLAGALCHATQSYGGVDWWSEQCREPQHS